MKIIKQTKKGLTVELSPYELDVLRHAITKESGFRRKTWKTVKPTVPEELIYHLLMHDTAEQMKSSIYYAFDKFKEWKILN